ncbi:transglycosylase SLT domain-containing protein [Sphingomonas sp. GlSt437]|uniref:lytic transglycosylase domain-containing protein n=2 Tax=Bacteria TaxID=2 RepID=UPI003A883025
MTAILALALAIELGGLSAPALANDLPTPPAAAPVTAGVPAQLDPDQRAQYRAVFDSIRAGKWIDARLQLAAMKPGPLHNIALAELFTAKGSPKATLDDLTQVLTAAPELPEAEALARLAKTRGAEALPELPYTRAMSWVGGAPIRRRARSLAQSDAVSADLAVRMQPFIKGDDGVGAQALLDTATGLSPEALTEWQHKVAWIYYLAGDDANARAMATRAAAGAGEWVVQAQWVVGLAAWRQHDCAAAGRAFETVASQASDVEFRAAGLYWASRADIACERPDRVEAHLTGAAQYDETFYGLLAREALGIRAKVERPVTASIDRDWAAIGNRPNIRVAAALIEIGESDLADQVLRREARIGDPAGYQSLIKLTASLSLPATQIWLAHNAPEGASGAVLADARYPAPAWTPQGGWRVDKALVYAHALQESAFRANAISSAGAYGLMQIRPAAAQDIARQHGIRADRAALTDPVFNIEVGQSYLETLRDQPATGGLLPKVIAAYNAGPLPVALWNAQSRDGGDPLLYIESIPYWETRGYVVTVLRNYWMYERCTGRAASPSRAALVEGLWPRFPGLPGAAGVRVKTALAPPTPSATALAAAAAAAAAAQAQLQQQQAQPASTQPLGGVIASNPSAN